MGTAVTYRIRCMTNEDEDFYMLIGPFLSRRSIVKEIGGPIWDDDGMYWYVALSSEHEVLGFAATREKRGNKQSIINELDNAYVLPEYREQGIYASLLDARIAMCLDGSLMRAVVNVNSREQFFKRGFTVHRHRGKSFVEVEKVKE